MKLLTAGNPKMLKGQKLGYLSYILHLAPARLSGYNACPMSSPGCASGCLNTSGRGRFDKTQLARIRKTRLFFEDRSLFIRQLIKDIQAGIRKAKRENLIPCFRLNGTSDIRWENYGIISQFPDVQFYDYTKIANRQNLPSNYHLTFSMSEDNFTSSVTAFWNDMNVAVVFRKIPSMFMGRPVVVGDEHDLRFLDPSGVYVGLKAKGQAKFDRSGFVR